MNLDFWECLEGKKTLFIAEEIQYLFVAHSVKQADLICAVSESASKSLMNHQIFKLPVQFVEQ